MSASAASPTLQPSVDLSSPEARLDAARSAVLAGHPDEARGHCDAALYALGMRLPGADAARLGAEALRIAARSHVGEGNADVALELLDAARVICEAAGDEAGAGHSLNNAGIVHYQHGRLDAAEALYSEAIEYAGRANDVSLRAVATMNLGIVANVRGDLQLALRHYKASLADYRVMGQVRNVAATLNNMGMLHVDLGQWRLAERAYDEALKIITEMGDLDALALLHGNIAEMWIGRADPARARAACDDAMAVWGRTAHASGIGEAHKIYGVVAREQGAYAEAEEHLDRARDVADRRSDLLLLAETTREQAELYRRQGRNADTLRALNTAHRLFDGLRARRELADIGRRVGRIEDEFVEVARRWGESIEAKDRYTQGHCKRVADLACLIAATAGLDQQSMFWFRIGALLHDVGKLVIPEEVLNKPGKLSDEEWQLMRSHTVAGVEMLSGIEFPWDVRPIVLSHHERWDGKGYPHGLKGEEIPLVARILCVADVYDALTSVRSYKRALSHDEAIEILRRDVGTMFDPLVFGYFERVAESWAPRTAAMQRAAAAESIGLLDTPTLAPGHDPLTRLPLAPLAHAEAARLLGARATIGRTMAALVITVQTSAVAALRFGGQPTGEACDDIRRGVTDALSRNTRGGDFVARLAEDEFVVLLPDAQPAEARAAADRLRDALGAVLGTPGGVARRGTGDLAAIGVAMAPAHGDTPDALFAAARDSLAQARTGELRTGEVRTAEVRTAEARASDARTSLPRDARPLSGEAAA